MLPRSTFIVQRSLFSVRRPQLSHTGTQAEQNTGSPGFPDFSPALQTDGNDESVASDRLVTIHFSGNASTVQRRHFDLFPVEHSSDLIHWSRLGIATRTNAAAGRAFFTHRPELDISHAFYRTPTNILPSPLPPLTGNHAVGSFSRLLTDSSRTNATRRTNHQFMVTFFYPAEPRPAVLPAPYWERAMIGDMFNWYQFAIDRTWFGRDFVEASLAAAEERWPIHPLIEPHRINELSAGYLVSFFKKYLRGEDDHRLDDPSAGASEVLKYVKR